MPLLLLLVHIGLQHTLILFLAVEVAQSLQIRVDTVGIGLQYGCPFRHGSYQVTLRRQYHRVLLPLLMRLGWCLLEAYQLNLIRQAVYLLLGKHQLIFVLGGRVVWLV